MSFTIRSPLVLDLVNRQLGVRKTPSQVFDVAGLISSDSPLASTATAGNPAVTINEGALVGLDASYATYLKADTTSHGAVLMSNVANSGTNAALLINTVATLSGTTSLLTLATNGVQKWKFGITAMTFPDGTTQSTAASGGGGGTLDYVIVKDEGTTINNATALNFVGDGVTVTDAGSGVATVTIPGGGGGGGGGTGMIFSAGDPSVTLTNDSTERLVSWTEVYDPGNDFNEGTSTWVCPATGWYIISASVNVGVAAGTDAEITFYTTTNGTGGTGGNQIIFQNLINTEGISGATQHFTCVGEQPARQFTAGDQIQVWAYNTGTSSASITDLGEGHLTIRSAEGGSGGGGGDSVFQPTPGGEAGDIQYIDGCVSVTCLQDAGSAAGPDIIEFVQTEGDSVLQSQSQAMMIPQRVADYDDPSCSTLLFVDDGWNLNYGSTLVYPDATTEIVADPTNFGALYGGNNYWQGVGCPLDASHGFYGMPDDGNTGQFSYALAWKFNWSTKSFTQLANPPITTANFAVNTGTGKILVAGGHYGASSFYHGDGRFYLYDITGNSWSLAAQPGVVSGLEAWADGGSPDYGGAGDNVDFMLVMANGDIMVKSGSTSISPNTIIYHPGSDTWTAGGDSLGGLTGQEIRLINLPDGNVLSWDTAGQAQFYDVGTLTWTWSEELDISGGPAVDEHPWAVPVGPGYALVGCSSANYLLNTGSQEAVIVPEIVGAFEYGSLMGADNVVVSNLEGQHPSNNIIAFIEVSSTPGTPSGPSDRIRFETPTTKLGGTSSTTVPETTLHSPTHKASGVLSTWMNGPTNVVANMHAVNGLAIYGDEASHTDDPNALLLQIGKDATAINTADFWNSRNLVKIFSKDLDPGENGGGHAISANVLVTAAARPDGEWYEHTGYYFEGHVQAVNDSEPSMLAYDFESYLDHNSGKIGQAGAWNSVNVNGSGDVGWITVVDAEAFNDGDGTTDKQVAFRGISQKNGGSGELTLLRGIEVEAVNNANASVPTIQGAYTYAANVGGWTIQDVIGTLSIGAVNAGGGINGVIAGYMGQAVTETGSSGAINSIQGLNLYTAHKGSGTVGFLCGITADTFLDGSGTASGDVIGAQITAHKANSGTVTGWVYGAIGVATQDTGSSGANLLIGMQANAYNAGGSVNTMIGLRVPTLGGAGTAATNAIGITVEDQTAANATNKFALMYAGQGNDNSVYLRANGYLILGPNDDGNAKLRSTLVDPTLSYSSALFGNLILNSTPTATQVTIYGEMDYGGGEWAGRAKVFDAECYVAPQTGTTLGWAMGYYAYNENDGPGDTDHMVGMFIDQGWIGDGAVNNNYGIYIDDQNIGASEQWQIYCNSYDADIDGMSWALDVYGKQYYSYTDNTGTPGANTAHTTSGKCKIAAAASSVVVTNARVTADTIIDVVVNQASEDTTLTRLRYTATNGSFTVFGNAAATADVQISWSIKN
jgi:hypothetical protein